jgi:hypothetical protein
MKTYTTPQFVTKGCVVEATKTIRPGQGDPKDMATLVLFGAGSVGFQL